MSQLKDLPPAIASFSQWGAMSPRAHTGKKLLALALWKWSESQLRIFQFEPMNKSPTEYYAGVPTSRGSGLIVTPDGWHCTEKKSRDAREKWGRQYYSWIQSPANEEELLGSLSINFRKKVESMVKHLHSRLGSMDWQQWSQERDEYNATIQRNWMISHEPPMLHPVRINGAWQTPSSSPLLMDSNEWPPCLTAAELVEWMACGAYQRSFCFFTMQEKLGQYLASNPSCSWTQEHARQFIEKVAKQHSPRGKPPSRLSTLFETRFHETSFPIDTTVIVHPSFHRWLPEMELSLVKDEDLTTVHWLRATYFDITNEYGMYGSHGVFRGQSSLQESDLLQFNDLTFTLQAARGQRGVIASWNSAGVDEDTQLDALRQIRAYCGGVVGVKDEVYNHNPSFWDARWERKEVAMAGGKTHWYWSIETPTLSDRPKPIVESLAAGLESSYDSIVFGTPQQKVTHHTPGIFSSRWGWKAMDDIVLSNSALLREIQEKTRYELWNLWEKNLTPLQAAHVSKVLNVSAATVKDFACKVLPVEQVEVCMMLGADNKETWVSALQAHGLKTLDPSRPQVQSLPTLVFDLDAR